MSDFYVKKTVSLPVANRRLQFDVAQALFSSHEVDAGSKLLIDSLLSSEHRTGWRRVLDLGCGYGTLGLALKAADKRRAVHLVDRDALAVAFTQRNAEKNELDVTAVASLGFDDEPAADYDLIVSNIPGKAGDAVIGDLLAQASRFLQPDGLVAIVVVAPLAALVQSVLAATPDAEIVHRELSNKYGVFHYRFTGKLATAYEPALARGIYDRHSGIFTFRKLKMPMTTVTGLPEFDTLSYQTRLLFNLMEGQAADEMERVVVVNPGQGHTAVVAWKLWQPARITLVDRDLLALRVAARNLRANGCPAERIASAHQPTWALPDGAPPADALLGVLRDSDGPVVNGELLDTAVPHLAAGAPCLVAANSHLISQLSRRLGRGWRAGKRKRRKGFSGVVLTP